MTTPEERVQRALWKWGLASTDVHVARLGGGGNNQVFRIDAGAHSYVAKAYFHDSSDSRDRLAAEYSFLTYAWSIGVRCIPQPLYSDPADHIAVYGHIDGHPPDAAGIDETRVREAGRFFGLLNKHRADPLGRGLPLASEACFSTAEHVRLIERRIMRLGSIRADTPVDRDAIALVSTLTDLLRAARSHIIKVLPDETAPLADAWRCISPSDFGFHNSLITATGALAFLDFEYGGWDDTAKAIGDFFSHPGVAVAPRYLDAFTAEWVAEFEDDERMLARARLLLPLFRIKWCCIILNEFLPSAARRRQFADPTADLDRRKLEQLHKARRLAAEFSC